MRRILQQNPDNAVGGDFASCVAGGPAAGGDPDPSPGRRLIFRTGALCCRIGRCRWRRSWPIGWRRCAGSAIGVPRRWCSDRDRKPPDAPVYFPAGAGRAGQGGADEGAAHRPAPRLRTSGSLPRHDWQYVSRITGMEAAALNAHFGTYMKESTPPPGQAGRDGTH